MRQPPPHMVAMQSCFRSSAVLMNKRSLHIQYAWPGHSLPLKIFLLWASYRSLTRSARFASVFACRSTAPHVCVRMCCSWAHAKAADQHLPLTKSESIVSSLACKWFAYVQTAWQQPFLASWISETAALAVPTCYNPDQDAGGS